MTKLLQDVNLGVNLKRLRNLKGLSQEAVCAQLATRGRPMLQSNYAQIESGKRNLFISDLLVLKEIFGADYSDIFRDLQPINKYDLEESSLNK